MTAFDYLAALPRIEDALSDPSLNSERRKTIANELLQSLPTGLSVRSAPSTFEYIRDRIRYHRDRADAGNPEPTAEVAQAAPRKARKAAGAAAGA